MPPKKIEPQFSVANYLDTSLDVQVVAIASCSWWGSCTPLAHRALQSRRAAWQLG